MFFAKINMFKPEVGDVLNTSWILFDKKSEFKCSNNYSNKNNLLKFYSTFLSKKSVCFSVKI